MVKMEYGHGDMCHCADWQPDCPNNCFRARLTKEYKENEDKFIGIPTSWASFGKTATCRRQEGCPCKTCEAEHCFNPLVCDKYTEWITR